MLLWDTPRREMSWVCFWRKREQQSALMFWGMAEVWDAPHFWVIQTFCLWTQKPRPMAIAVPRPILGNSIPLIQAYHTYKLKWNPGGRGVMCNGLCMWQSISASGQTGDIPLKASSKNCQHLSMITVIKMSVMLTMCFLNFDHCSADIVPLFWWVLSKNRMHNWSRAFGFSQTAPPT